VHTPPILPWFTFNEGRHTHATWLAEDGIPEVARRARLGQKMKGMARVYDHVTDVMRKQVLDALEARWLGSVASLTAHERAELMAWFRACERCWWRWASLPGGRPSPFLLHLITEAPPS
jgi:hypothetical protein